MAQQDLAVAQEELQSMPQGKEDLEQTVHISQTHVIQNAEPVELDVKYDKGDFDTLVDDNKGMGDQTKVDFDFFGKGDQPE